MTVTEPAPPAGPPVRPSRRRWLAVAAAGLALFVGSAFAGRGLESTWSTGSGSGPSATSDFRIGSATLGNGSDTGGAAASTGRVDVDTDTIAKQANPAIVNIQTRLEGGQAAGTGMVISKSGAVLTNNHVIEGATEIKVEIGVTGKTYDAQVVGYDVADDVALLQLEDASGMKTVDVGDVSTVDVRDPVVAIGNAQGRFGTPSVVAGVVTDLDKTITAGDSAAETETLDDMIEIQADIQPGDSGGPLFDAEGRVIGVNTAADVGGSQFGFRTAGTTGYAIPIGKALTIVDEIRSGDESNGAHVGGHRAMLGIALDPGAGSDAGDGFGGFGGFGEFGDPSGSRGSTQSGAVIAQVQAGSAADSAGLAEGDTIVALDGRGIDSADELRTALEGHDPGDSVRVEWVDSLGASHQATVQLDVGPPA